MKAQSSVSVLIALSTIFVIAFLLYSVTINPNEFRSMSSGNYMEAQTICEKFQSSINSAVMAGSGFSNSLELPYKLNGKDYSIMVYPNHIYILWGNENYICQFYSGDITLKANETWTAVNIAYLQKERCLTNVLLNFNTTIYCNDKASNDCPEIPTPCSDPFYKLEWSMSRFFNDLSNYDILFIEDPHFSTQSQFDQVAAQVNLGAPLFLSEHLGSVTNPFGMTLKSSCSTQSSATVINTDPLISFSVGNVLSFAERPCLYGDLKKIATFDGTIYAPISKINYGDGFVFYYSDFDGTIVQGSGTFQEKVIQNLNLTATYVATYQKPPFNITRMNIVVSNIDGEIFLDQKFT